MVKHTQTAVLSTGVWLAGWESSLIEGIFKILVGKIKVFPLWWDFIVNSCKNAQHWIFFKGFLENCLILLYKILMTFSLTLMPHSR